MISVDHPVVIAAARHGLPASVVLPLPPAELSALDRADVVRWCHTDRIAGLLAAAVADGAVILDREPTAAPATGVPVDVTAAWQDTLRVCVRVEALLLRVAARLDAVGVRWLLTKGAAVAHLDYPDPAWRGFADVDLVVHPMDLQRTLVALDHAPPGAATQRYLERYGKGRTVLLDDMEVDVHVRFAIGRFGLRCRLAECCAFSDQLTLGGRALPVLIPEYRLLHACFHAVLGGQPGARALRDVAQLALRSDGTVERALSTAHRWQVEAVVGAAVRAAWARLHLDPSHPAARAVMASCHSSSRADRAALDVFARLPAFRAQALTGLGALPLRQRPQFLWTLAAMARQARSEREARP